MRVINQVSIGIFYLASSLILISQDVARALIVLLLLLSIFYFKKFLNLTSSIDANFRKSWYWMLAGFAIFILSKFATGIYHNNHIGYYEVILPFLLMPALTIGMSNYKPVLKNWLFSMTIGVIVASIWAIDQVFVQGIGRAVAGVGNPILFGDASVAIGALLVVAFASYYRNRSQTNMVVFILLIGGILAILNSLLSGSKGGWLTILSIVAVGSFLIVSQRGRLYQRIFMMAIAIVIAVLTFLLPSETVVDRVVSGVVGGLNWFQTGQVSDGSVGIRFEMWAFSWKVFLDNPLWGVGSSQMHNLWLLHVDSVRLDSTFKFLVTRDNELIETLATSGLVGFFGWFALYFGVGMSFWRLRNHSNDEVKMLSLCGLILVLAFLEFGLSVNTMGVGLFRLFFAFATVSLLVFATFNLRSNN